MSVINIYRNEALHCKDVLGFTLIELQSIIANEWTGRGSQTPDDEAFLNRMEMVFESERLLKRMIKQIDDNVFFSPTPKELKQEKDEAKSFDTPFQWREVEENEVEINHQIDQAKEDELGW